MLGEHPITPVLLAKDLAAAREFRHDMPGLKTKDGIADLGSAWAAWIIDSGRNALGLLQLKG